MRVRDDVGCGSCDQFIGDVSLTDEKLESSGMFSSSSSATSSETWDEQVTNIS